MDMLIIAIVLGNFACLILLTLWCDSAAHRKER